MTDDSLAGIVWCLTRLQTQCEAVIMALEKQQPGFQQLVSEELQQIREGARLLQIATENKRELAQVSDWRWLKSQGIDPDSQTT